MNMEMGGEEHGGSFTSTEAAFFLWKTDGAFRRGNRAAPGSLPFLPAAAARSAYFCRRRCQRLTNAFQGNNRLVTSTLRIFWLCARNRPSFVRSFFLRWRSVNPCSLTADNKPAWDDMDTSKKNLDCTRHMWQKCSAALKRRDTAQPLVLLHNNRVSIAIRG
jgi:hypothetical protein